VCKKPKITEAVVRDLGFNPPPGLPTNKIKVIGPGGRVIAIPNNVGTLRKVVAKDDCCPENGYRLKVPGYRK